MNKKKILSVILLLVVMTTMSGCWKYGKGETTGYVYAVEDGIIWDEVWYKSSLDSSESDCYLIDDDVLKSQLASLPSGTLVKLSYDRHFFTASMCPDGTATDDEIISFEIIKAGD